MTSLNISLPDSLRDWVDKQVEQGHYGTASEFIRELIRDAQKRRAQDNLEAKLLEGMASGDVREVTPQFWGKLRERVQKRLSKKKTG